MAWSFGLSAASVAWSFELWSAASINCCQRPLAHWISLKIGTFGVDDWEFFFSTAILAGLKFYFDHHCCSPQSKLGLDLLGATFCRCLAVHRNAQLSSCIYNEFLIAHSLLEAFLYGYDIIRSIWAHFFYERLLLFFWFNAICEQLNHDWYWKILSCSAFQNYRQLDLEVLKEF